MSDPGTTEIRDRFAYLVTAACPRCGGISRFVEVRDGPVALDTCVTLTEVEYCPSCGARVPSIVGEWDRHSEYEIETVTPTQEREDDDD